MAHYRKIDTRIWNDGKFLALSDRGKLAFMFLLTHPHLTAVGAMRSTIPGMAHELGWTERAFGEAFGEALSKGMAKHDAKSCFVWIPNFLRYNRPESPNVVRSWPSSIDMLPECVMKSQLLFQLKAFAEGLTKGFREAFDEAFDEAFAKGMPNQEQEHKQEQEQEHKQEEREDAEASNSPKRFTPPTVADVRAYVETRPKKIDPERFVDYYDACGWKLGKASMTNWKSAVHTWEKNENGNRRTAREYTPNPGLEYVPPDAE